MTNDVHSSYLSFHSLARELVQASRTRTNEGKIYILLPERASSRAKFPCRINEFSDKKKQPLENFPSPKCAFFPVKKFYLRTYLSRWKKSISLFARNSTSIFDRCGKRYFSLSFIPWEQLRAGQTEKKRICFFLSNQ